ncbi:ADP-ribosylglycohydrolase-domain-containing protein [Haematococcus lacustris]
MYCVLAPAMLSLRARVAAAPLRLSRTALMIVAAAAASTSNAHASMPLSTAVLTRAQDSFLASLCGDALSLGGHYEYDAKKIKAMVGRYTDYTAPGQGMGGATHGVGWGSHNYHPGKVAGDGTDAGEVAVMLLEYLVQAGGVYSFEGYERYWREQILEHGYGSCNFQTVGPDGQCPPGTRPGYLNGGTRRTLAALQQYPQATGQLRQRLAANVNCLVAATHFGPLLMVARSEEELVQAAVSTVYLSHCNPDPVAAAEFLARALWRIVHQSMGLEPALLEAAGVMNNAFIHERLRQARAKVAEALDPGSALSKEEMCDDLALTSLARLWDVGKSEPIKVGKASPTEGALPGALYFALKYKDNLEEALIANAGCGGDSAVRGMVIGMLLGAVHGRQALPVRWMSGLRAAPHVTELMDRLAGEVTGATREEL